MALIHRGRKISYRELNRRANHLAYKLRDLDIGPESLVAIGLDRSIELFVGMFGILKAGGAYIPIDPNLPQIRVESIINDSQSQLLITHSSFQKKFNGFNRIVLDLDNENSEIDHDKDKNPNCTTISQNLVYVIYTSGSTGMPKGVMIEHRSVVNYLTWCKRNYPTSKGIGAPLHSSVSFDMSVTSLYLPLICGSTVYITENTFGPEALATMLKCLGDFSFIKLTPAHLNLLRQNSEIYKSKQLCQSFVVGGENLTSKDIEYWQKNFTNTEFFNEYGPTEATVGCCVHKLRSDFSYNGSVPIGQPIANTELYVLDKFQKPVSIGESGELFIGGTCLARGYLNRPELTKEKFIPHPFCEDKNAVIYSTGDLVRWLPDNNIEYLGRVDNQVKVRGYRIEMGDIESTILKHPFIYETLVLLSNRNILVAYLVCDPENSPSLFDIRSFIQRRFPDYMIPSTFIFLREFPLTLNGKIDRNKLREIDNFETGVEFVPPQTDLEKQLSTIWAELLSSRRIGIHDNFFLLGGHSILASKLSYRIQDCFHVEISMAAIYESATIEELARSIGVLQSKQNVGNNNHSFDIEKLIADIENMSSEEICIELEKKEKEL